MATWSFWKVDYFPKALALSLSTALLSALIIAIISQDVSIYLPYISEAGAKPPAARVFSIFLDLTSALCSATIIVRYMIVEVWDKSADRSLHSINAKALIAGLLSMVGMSTVAAFPVSCGNSLADQFEIHFLGAFMLFGFSLVYGFLQTWLSYQLCPTYNCLFLCRLRLVIMVTSLVMSWIIVIGGAVGFHLFGPSTEDHWSGKKTPEDQGFMYLFVSSLAEWLQTICFIFFYLTLIPEFKNISVHVNVQYSDTNTESSTSNGIVSNGIVGNGVAKSKLS